MPMVQVLLLLPPELLQEIDARLEGQAKKITVKVPLTKEEIWEANQIANTKGKVAWKKFVAEKTLRTKTIPADKAKNISRNEFIRQLLKKALTTK